MASTALGTGTALMRDGTTWMRHMHRLGAVVLGRGSVSKGGATAREDTTTVLWLASKGMGRAESNGGQKEVVGPANRKE